LVTLVEGAKTAFGLTKTLKKYIRHRHTALEKVTAARKGNRNQGSRKAAFGASDRLAVNAAQISLTFADLPAKRAP
jgi:hypothetical protein